MPAMVLAAYVVGGLAVLRTILSFNSLVYVLLRCWRWLEERTQVYQFFEIPRYADDGAGGVSAVNDNPMYRKALAYLSSLPSLEDSGGAVVFSSERKRNEFSLHPGAGAEAYDSFRGDRVRWTRLTDRLVLRLRRHDARRVLRPYLQHVEAVAEELGLRRRELRLFVHSSSGDWRSVPLVHPATFDSIAMDPDVKAKVRADLEAFQKARSGYHRAGRAWRRSYLLHGPPGTGKSTFAAVMAKFLCYDIYELSISTVAENEIRSLLLRTTPRSLILVEDVDRYLERCGVDEEARDRRLSGIMEMMDGVSASCNEERILVFTVRNKEGIEPAALRPGRIDVQINFRMCDFLTFKSLASSYLGLKDHKLYAQVEEVFNVGSKLSPAEVGEIMLANRSSPSRAIKSLITALQQQQQQQQQCSDNAAAPYSRRTHSGTRFSFSESLDEDFEEPAGGGVGIGAGLAVTRNATIREFRKLYGFIKRNPSRREGVMPVEVAIAAAAAAATAANGNADKEL